MNNPFRKKLIEVIKKDEKEIAKGYYVSLEQLRKDLKKRMKNTR